MFRLFFIAIFLLTASPVWAISFDLWKTGMSRQDIIALAKEQNLPLAKNLAGARTKSFNPQLLVGETELFCYSSTLLEQNAFVQLQLSPPKGNYGQFLYEIDIQFPNNAEFRPYLIKLLEDKYGRGSSKPDMIRKILVWQPEPEGEITLIITPALIQLIYTDKKIKTFAENLRKTTYGLPVVPTSHQDAKRF